MRKPALADRVSDGKYADFATPICALAAAIARSAAAISGRRSSSSEGTLAGMSGIAIVEMLGGERKLRRRLADEYRDRVFELRALHADVDRLRLRALQLRLRLHDIDVRRDTRVIAVARELERFLERGHGVVEQLALLVEHAQLEIIEGELRLRQQAHRLARRPRSPARWRRWPSIVRARCPTDRAPS